MEKLKKLKNVKFFELINYFFSLCAKMRTLFFYRFFFGGMGRSVSIYKPLLIAHPHRIFIGNSVIIRSGVRLEVVLTDMEKKPILTIGNNVNIEQNVHIICGSRVIIGDNVSITGGAAIVDVNHPYEDVDNDKKIGNRIQAENNYVEIGEGVFIGYGAIILPNVKIGRRAVIGAYSVVSRDVPEFSVVAGNPAKVIKKYCFENSKWKKI